MCETVADWDIEQRGAPWQPVGVNTLALYVFGHACVNVSAVWMLVFGQCIEKFENDIFDFSLLTS